MKPILEKTITGLIQFLKAIPGEKWCAFTRDDYEGHHCVLGHIDNAICASDPDNSFASDGYVERLGLSPHTLAEVNNGTLPGEFSGAKDGPSCKERVISYLNRHVQ